MGQIHSDWFQFLIGTLKTGVDAVETPFPGQFQFLIGTLKTGRKV